MAVADSGVTTNDMSPRTPNGMSLKSSPREGGGLLTSPRSKGEREDVYLSELLSYSLERLNKEPELLRADCERIQRQLSSVAVENYKSFIVGAEALSKIRAEAENVRQHLDMLTNRIPELEEGCTQFTDVASRVLEKRRNNNAALASHSQLLDLLEAPQLMDTCVRNGNFDEALELQNFINKMATLNPGLKVAQALKSETDATTQIMIQQLLSRLRHSIQLPECLRVVGYLRRLAVFQEAELRRQFLKCREAWLEDSLDEIGEPHDYETLKRTTDTHRIVLFDIVMQYRAIFADDTSQADSLAMAQDASGSADGGLLLYSWAQYRTSLYLQSLENALPNVKEAASLASLLEHCMYCGMSLGRVGLDFRPLLSSIFESTIIQRFSDAINQANGTFQAALSSHKWIALPKTGTGSATDSSRNSQSLTPPFALLEHPPLALFTNSVLQAFNDLRHCAPSALRGHVSELLQAALETVAGELGRFAATRVLHDTESDLFQELCRMLIDTLVPFLNLALNRLFPKSTSTGYLNSSSSPATQNMLEVTKIETPLRDVLNSIRTVDA